MAGHMAYFYLKATGKYKISNVVFRNKLTQDSIVVDVTNLAEVEKVVFQQKPDIILNCIGVLIKGAKEHPDNAILLNAYFPNYMKKMADKVNGKLIHISTDCVFSGKKGFYSEEDFRDADDVYGRSKALGEISNEKDLTIRTSIIGPELKTAGEGLFHWFMCQKGHINGFTEAYWGGVTTLELVKAIDSALDSNITGLVHLTNGEKISKFDLLNLFKRIWNRDDIQVDAYNGKSVDKSLVKSNKFLHQVPSYQKMLEEQYVWMEQHRELYSKVYCW